MANKPKAALAKLGNRVRLFRRLWQERASLHRTLDFDNYRFLRFAPPGHFYSPIPDIKEIRRETGARTNEISGIDLRPECQLALAQEFAKHYSELPFPREKADGFRYYLDNPFYGYGDGITLYSMMRVFKPKRVIEIGSGFSSAAMLDVSERFFDGSISFTFVEPNPERLLGLLRGSDRANCRLVQQPVQSVDSALFEELAANDILFIDSSHVAKSGSDVAHLLFNVIPLLRGGVLIHFHDILWPFEYPRLWFEDGRAWNEAYFLRAFMQFNSAFEIVYFNSMMAIKNADFMAANLPLVLVPPSSQVTPSSTSLWIKRK